MEFSQLKVGMRVVVGPRPVPGTVVGWSTRWVSEMNGAVGHTYEIKLVDAMWGDESQGVILRRIPGDTTTPEPPNCWFPWHNLTKAVEPVEVRDLLDSSLHGPNQYDRAEIRYSWWLRSPFNAQSTLRSKADAKAAAQAERIQRFAEWKQRRDRALASLNLQLLAATKPRTWRYEDATWRIPAIQQMQGRLKAMLVALRSANRPTSREINTFLSDCTMAVSYQTVKQGIYKALKRACPDLGVTSCDECGSWHKIPSQNSVVGGRRVCPSCFDNTYVYSEIEARHINRDRAARIYRSADEWHNRSSSTTASAPAWVSREAALRYPSHPQNNRVLFTQEAFAAIFRHGRELSGDLDGYHGAERDFTEVVTAGDPFPALGVELEVEVAVDEDDDPSEVRSAAVLAVRRLEEDFICERDGSLSDSRGFEIVTKPYGKREWPRVAEMLLKTCAEHNAKGYNTTGHNGSGPLRYGIHVNIHRRHLSSLQEARLLMFMGAADNADFVRAMAQRWGLYGDPEVDMGTVEKRQLKLRTFGGVINKETYNRTTGDYSNERKIRGLGKYSAINLKDNVAEFRIFQSTTYYPSFMKNLEFVWALVEWTSTKASTGNAWHHRDFVSWLSKRGGAKKDFPHLWDYLRRESYTVKQSKRRIDNAWVELLPSTLEGEIDEAASEVQASAVVIPLRREAQRVEPVQEELPLDGSTQGEDRVSRPRGSMGWTSVAA